LEVKPYENHLYQTAIIMPSIGLPKSIEELFGKRKNKPNGEAAIFIWRRAYELCFDEWRGTQVASHLPR